ncbi:hypothetical protein [Haloarcula marina]|uniref:hypothetical protein n=1 Tax=Haloarcula marina TaxID=2961574 RepID=UPI0020B653C4|nr:hypothetical protein [Halomicroarcula marina]
MRSEDDTDCVKACPECDSTGLSTTVRDTTDHDYYCRNCTAELDAYDLVERERYEESGLQGLAGKLARMDPEEVGDGDGRLVTDGGRRKTHIGDAGLYIPADLREFEGQVVFRTPRCTIQHFGSQALAAYYGLIDADDFGDVAEMPDPKNPDLAPNGLRITPQGGESVEFEVETEPEIRTDGGPQFETPAEKHLVGEANVEFQCAVAANDQFDHPNPEFCDHEPETVTLDDPAYVDGNGNIHVPGRPVECPECGNPHEFVFNGVWVFFG